MGRFTVILCATGLINGAIGMISPDGELKKYVRLVGALCILLAMVAPIYESAVSDKFAINDLFTDIEQKEEQYGDVYKEYLVSGSRKEAEDTLGAFVVKKFRLEDDDIALSVGLVKNGDRYEVDGLKIYVKGSAVLIDPREIKAYLGELTGCECEIIYGEGGE